MRKRGTVVRDTPGVWKGQVVQRPNADTLTSRFLRTHMSTAFRAFQDNHEQSRRRHFCFFRQQRGFLGDARGPRHLRCRSRRRQPESHRDAQHCDPDPHLLGPVQSFHGQRDGDVHQGRGAYEGAARRVLDPPEERGPG